MGKSAARKLVIDARPRGPRGAFATECLQGRSVLDHLIGVVETTATADQAIVLIVPSLSDSQWITSASSRPILLSEGPPAADTVVLRTDRLYDANRLRRALRRGDDPESAVFWRLDRPGGLLGADDELRRRQSYQPLGKYWALDSARWIARRLSPTRVRPNAVTIAASALMLAASGLVAFTANSMAVNLLIGSWMALALILDTADGHLARLQGTASDFGRHLDAWLDELCDMALHAAIAWATFISTGQPGWLLAGMAYAMGKYIFYVGTSVSSASENEHRTNDRTVRPSLARRAVRFAGHADVRWHLWIALGVVGRLDLALVVYAIYYPARAFFGLAGKAKEARHG